MNKPTAKQVKEFWEWCGFTVYEKDGGKVWWDYPDGSYKGLGLPPIDLNNLFKWAIPKLQDEGKPIDLFAFEQEGFEVKIYDIVHGWGEEPIVSVKDKDPALALFWALWGVKND